MSTEFKPRLVECLKTRKGGTTVTFDECADWPAGSYTFAAGSLKEGRHAAMIPVREHYTRLISIPEAYRPASADDAAETPVAPTLAQSAPKAAPAKQAPETPEDDDSNEDVWDPVKVLALGVNKIISLTKAHTDEQLRELLQLEQEREDPRETLIKSINGTLRARG